MDTVSSLVFLAIGALIGGLLALAVDSRYLGRRLRAAVEAKKRLQGELKLIARRLAVSQANVRQLSARLDSGIMPMVKQTRPSEIEPPRAPEAEAELVTLRDNLRRMGNQSDQLVAEKQELSIRLAEASGKWSALQDQLARVSDENRGLQEKNEQLHHELGAAQVEIRYLRQGIPPVEQESSPVDEEPDHPPLSSPVLAPTELIEADETIPPYDEMSAGLETILDSEMAVEPVGAETSAEPDREVMETADPAIIEPPASGKSDEASSQIRKVRGIGPVYASRLQESGVHTLADLAEMTPGELTVMLGLKGSQLAKPGDWIEQAREMAAEISDEASPPEDPAPLPTTDLSRNG